MKDCFPKAYSTAAQKEAPVTKMLGLEYRRNFFNWDEILVDSLLQLLSPCQQQMNWRISLCGI